MSSHYFEPDPKSAARPHAVDLVLPDLHLRLATDSGVFSGERVDRGTRILLEHTPAPPPEGDLLDLGCGYGPIALTLARRSPRATVWAVDVNERALSLCRRNAADAGLGNVRVCRPGRVDSSVRFAGIWSNPPVRIGKPALRTLLTEWLGCLADGARAYLVIQRHLGADSLQRMLTADGWPTLRIAARSGYRVLEAADPQLEDA